MKPLIEIQRIAVDAYSYRISASGAAAQETDRTFASLECCLVDAGDSLGAYFPQVEVNFDGMFLGSCTTDALRSRAEAVAQRIKQHFQPA